MSVQTLYTAATGMGAMETKLDVIANNLANLNTTAFKAERANFEDLFYRNYKLPGSLDQQGNYTAVGTAVGLGTRVSSTQTNFQQGAFATTNNQLDVAIAGEGFFPVIDTNGQTVYTRADIERGRQVCPQEWRTLSVASPRGNRRASCFRQPRSVLQFRDLTGE